MKKITAHKLSWNNVNDIKKAQDFLKNNASGISTTDTIPGLVAPINENGYKSLCAIKENRQGKPFLILISDPKKINLFINTETLTPITKSIIDAFWPGPLTIIFRAKPSLPSFIQSDTKTIAIRCPHHEGLQKLLIPFDGLFSTSANKSTHPPPMNICDIHNDILTSISFILDSFEPPKIKTIKQSQTSTIIDCTTNTPHLIREGLIPFSEIKKHYEKIK